VVRSSRYAAALLEYLADSCTDFVVIDSDFGLRWVFVLISAELEEVMQLLKEVFEQQDQLLVMARQRC
jgi:hypothetical protein